MENPNANEQATKNVPWFLLGVAYHCIGILYYTYQADFLPVVILCVSAVFFSQLQQADLGYQQFLRMKQHHSLLLAIQKRHSQPRLVLLMNCVATGLVTAAVLVLIRNIFG